MTFFMEVEPPVATLPERSPAAEAATEEAAVLEAAAEEAVVEEAEPPQAARLSTMESARSSAENFFIFIGTPFIF